MSEIFQWVAGVLNAVLRVVLWLVMAALALGLLLVALVFLAVGVLWALLRGRRPQAPVYMGQFRRFTSERVWPGGAPWQRQETRDTSEIVDVEVREVSPADEGATRPPETRTLEDRRQD